MFAPFLFIVILLYILFHLRPLNGKELNRLVHKRHKQAMSRHLRFTCYEYNVDRNFKKRMEPNGRFYRLNETLYDFPGICAALLKYKKHEWIVIAMEKKGIVELAWLNKGFTNDSACLMISAEELRDIACAERYQTILFFHNHPNSNPRYYDCTKPSRLDLETAKEFSALLNPSGLNLVEFICERGRFYEYHRSLASDPATYYHYAKPIMDKNNHSRIGNLFLHLSRVF